MENFVSVIWAYRSNLKLLNCHQQWVVNLDCQPKMSMAQGKIYFNINILFSQLHLYKLSTKNSALVYVGIVKVCY